MPDARKAAADGIKDRFRSIANVAAEAHKNLDDIESLGADIEEIEADLRKIIELTEKL